MGMKRLMTLFAVSSLMFGLVAVTSGQSLAADVFNNGTDYKCGQDSANGTPDVCTDAKGQGTKNDPVINIIKVAIDILSFIIGIAAVITIVVSGVRMIFSGGDSQAVASARSGLIYALAALAVVILAQALVAFVLDKVK
jgi:Type IV secretion system pilin